MNTIGSRVKAARKRLGLTQTDIQNSAGISSGNLSEIENNKCMPSSLALISLSRELEVSIDWLLTGSEYGPLKSNGLFAGETFPAESFSPETIILSKFYQLSRDNQLKVEGIIEGLLISQGIQLYSNQSHTESSEAVKGNKKKVLD